MVYKLGQQRQEGGISSNLVTAYLERAAKRRPSAHTDQRSALVVTEGNKSRLLTQLVGRGPLPLPTGLSPQIAATGTAAPGRFDCPGYPGTGDPGSLSHYPGGNQPSEPPPAAPSGPERTGGPVDRHCPPGPEGMEYVALRRGEAQTWQDLVHLTKQVGPNTALLSFFTTTDRALLFLLRAGGVPPHSRGAAESGWLG